jgi:guanylate kinase
VRPIAGGVPSIGAAVGEGDFGLGNRRRGLCLVVAAPSGAGKSSIVRGLLGREADVSASVSVTTRAPRPGEVEGRDYFFRSVDEFQAMAAGGGLLEHAIVFGQGYGTPRAPVEAALEAGHDLVLDIDWQGWRQLRTALPGDAVGVFVLPPSLAVLEARLRGRGSDSQAEVGRRMKAARDEISHWAEFDHVLVNDELGPCIDTITYILRASRSAVARNLGAAAAAAAMLAE